MATYFGLPVQSWDNLVPTPPMPSAVQNGNQGWTVLHSHASPSEIFSMNLDQCMQLFNDVLKCQNFILGQRANDIYTYSPGGTSANISKSGGGGIAVAQVQAYQCAADSDGMLLTILANRINMLQTSLTYSTMDCSFAKALGEPSERSLESSDKARSFWSFMCCPVATFEDESITYEQIKALDNAINTL